MSRFKHGEKVLLVNPRFEGKRHPQPIRGMTGVIVGKRGWAHGVHYQQWDDHWCVETSADDPTKTGSWWVQDDEGIQSIDVSQEDVDEAIQSILKGQT